MSRTLDLSAILGPLRHGPADPTIRVTPDEAAIAQQTPVGPATLTVRSDGRCHALGPGADWAMEQGPKLVGRDDDRTGFEPSRNRVIAALDARRPGLRIGASGRVLDLLVPTVLGQKVTSTEAHRSWGQMVHRFGATAPGGELLLPPTAEALAGVGYADLHPLGVERRRAEVIQRAARRAGELEVVAGDAERLGARLRAIPGIGPWTEAWLRMLSAGDRDAVPVGDHNLPALVAWNLAGERTADDRRMLELLEPFQGHRGRALRLVSLGGRTPPRHGPRRPIRSFSTS